jgi:4-aminobutyrate aminotransferase
VECLQYLKEDLEYIVPTEDIAAVIFEPILGEGGYIVPPQKYLDSLAQLCKDIGCLLIFDEVQSGMGRTGKMFAFEHFGVTPDILCIGKSIGGGFPMAVVVSTEEIMSQWESGSHGTTFGGHPVAAAAALAQLKILTKDGFLEEVAVKGDRFKTKLIKLQRRFPQLGDVRGVGLMIAIEFVGDAGEPNPKKAAEIRDRLFSENILVLPCGLKGQAIRFIPPLNIDENLLDNVVDVVAEALA